MTAHGGVEFAGEAPGLVDMVQHQLAHLRGIATSRRCQKLAVRRHVGVAQLLIGGMCGLITHRHQVPQQVIDDLAHEAQDTVGIGRGEDVVAVSISNPCLVVSRAIEFWAASITKHSRG